MPLDHAGEVGVLMLPPKSPRRSRPGCPIIARAIMILFYACGEEGQRGKTDDGMSEVTTRDLTFSI